jgi:hypothetical protein
VIFSQDDSAARIRERLELQGADLGRIIVSDEAFILDTKHVEGLCELIVAERIGAIFLDPLVDYTEIRDTSGQKEVSRAMVKLREVAKETGATIIGIRHIKKHDKAQGQEKKYLGMGSMAFIGKARSAIQVTELEKTPDHKKGAVEHIKANYTAEGPGLVYVLKKPEGFAWTDEQPPRQTPQVNRVPRELGRAQQLIREALRYGDVPAKEVLAAAKMAGISSATLDRAKDGLARSYRNKELPGAPSYWALLENEEPYGHFDDDDVVTTASSSSRREKAQRKNPFAFH